MTLPTDAKTRKQVPIHSGVFRYFPDALEALESAFLPEPEGFTKHLANAGGFDDDGERHSTKLAMLALDILQDELAPGRDQCVDYRIPFAIREYPDALAAIAACSKAGNDQHNPGQPLHWDRAKSTDELDALTRHLCQAGTVDTDGIRHSTKVAWRALANLQKELEAERHVEVISGVPETARLLCRVCDDAASDWLCPSCRVP